MNKTLSKILNPSRLSLAFLYYVIISALAAFVCQAVVFNGLNAVVGILMDHKNYYQRHIRGVVEDFQNYIDDNDVAIGDVERIENWNYDNWYVFLTVYRDGKICYTTMDRESRERELQLGYAYRHDQSLSYPVSFSDGDGEIAVRAYFEVRYRTLILIFSAGVTASCFVAVFLMLVRKKLKYITRIEKGIRILEDGSEEYRIPECGRDELYSLAHTINQMSDSLHREIEQKDRIQRERDEMITSLSHDIRTPLTSVLFYLDMITDKKCSGEQAENYMKKAKSQAYHMKKLMDDLFSYSYAVWEAAPDKSEIYDGNELVVQLLGDLLEALEERGFKTKLYYEVERPFALQAEVAQLRRVFDNLGTNVGKYAVKEETVEFWVRLDGDQMRLIQENPMREEEIEVESYGIGIKASQKIIEKMGGSFTYRSKNYRFQAVICLPIFPK
ncbi:MAG: HAMP domain-containing histidine kinase [Clostridiaceae bacterium]|nr:HAMP domain-containing histidine kinase [Clostridiaceae bacterium]